MKTRTDSADRKKTLIFQLPESRGMKMCHVLQIKQEWKLDFCLFVCFCRPSSAERRVNGVLLVSVMYDMPVDVLTAEIIQKAT